MDHLAEAVRIVGGIGKLAAGVGVVQSAASNWRRRGGLVPLERCAAIERLTGGKVTVDQLRSDGRWTRVPDADWPHPQGRPMLDFGRVVAVRALISDQKDPLAPAPHGTAAMNDVARKVA